MGGVRFVGRDLFGTVTGGRQFQANARKILARSLGDQKLLFGYVFSLRGVEAAKTWSRPLLRPRIPEERRRSPRHRLYRIAKIKIGAGIPPRDCLVIDVSDGGVRLFLDGFDAPRVEVAGPKLRDLVADRKTARPAAQPPAHPGSVELVTFRPRGAENRRVFKRKRPMAIAGHGARLISSIRQQSHHAVGSGAWRQHPGHSPTV